MIKNIQQLQQPHQMQVPKQLHEKPTTSFKDVLTKYENIKVSKHAKQRLSERNIQINDEQWETIGKKMNEAKRKGVTDSLIVMPNAALLVSTKNNTVVTAMNRDEATTRVFTNINGTILINK